MNSMELFHVGKRDVKKDLLRLVILVKNTHSAVFYCGKLFLQTGKS